MSSSRTINSFRNMIFGVGYQLLSIILAFVNRSVFIFTLGVSYLGISSLFSEILTMLSMADLGFGVALTYSMYKPLANKDYDQLAGLTHLYAKVYRTIAVVVFTIGVILIPFLNYIVNLKHPIPYIKLYYFMYLLNTVASYLVIYKTSILDADQKDYILNKYRSIFGITQTVFMTLFLWFTHSFFIYLLIQIIFTYVQNFYCSYIAEKEYPFIKKNVHLPLKNVKDIFKNLYSVFVYKVSYVMLTATDNTIISIFIGTDMVGYYSNYSMLTTRVITMLNAIFYAFTSSIGNLIVTEKPKKRYETFLSIQSLSLILAIFCVLCVALLAQDFIYVWLGSKYLISRDIFIAILINLYLQIILFPIWTFREATGLYLKTKYVMLLCAIINVILSILLARPFGVAGVLIASAIARLVTYFWLEPIYLFKKYFTNSSLMYFWEIFKNLLVLLVALFIFEKINLYFKSTTWIEFFIKTIVVSLVSAIFSIAIYYKSKGAMLIFSHVKQVFKRE